MFSTSFFWFAPRSPIGRFISKKTSWTLPDVRPKDPLIERNPNFAIQMRIAAAGEHRQRMEDKRNSPEGSTKPAIYGQTTRPGSLKPKERFLMQKQGTSKGAIRTRAKNMRFGAWSS